MAYYVNALSGAYDIKLPKWGRCFWQAPSDGMLFLAFASGTTEVYNITSADSGVTWSEPEFMFYVDDFSTHDNFDIFMDPRDHIHAGFRYNDSGCYQFFGRVAGGGWSSASGVGTVGFCTVGDSGSAKGFQGSLVVTEASGSLGDVSAAYPIVRVAAKDSLEDVDLYYMGYPYDSGYLLKDDAGGTNAGVNGGFPVVHNAGGLSTNAAAVTYFNATDHTIEARSRTGGGGAWGNEFLFPQTITSGTVAFGANQNLAIGSGHYRDFEGIHLVTSESGHEMWGTIIDGNTRRYRTLEQNANNDTWLWESLVARSGIYGASSGTHCDFSFDDSGHLHLYFQNRNSSSGRQTISRFLLDITTDSSFSETDTINCSNLWPSGRIDMFTANISNAGGRDGIVYWDGFKAARHPTSPGVGHTKGSYIVTQSYVPVISGSTAIEVSQLTVWNVNDSPAVQTPFVQPAYKIDYTATSGTSYPIFSGIYDVAIQSNVQNMFDGDVTTYGLFANNSSIILAFDEIRIFEKVEIVGQSFSSSSNLRDIGQIDLFTSYDDNTYHFVGTMPSGNALTGYTRTRTFTTDSEDIQLGDSRYFKVLIDTFAGKFIGMNWTTEYANSGRRISEIRVYGPGATSGEVYTFDQTYEHRGPARQQYVERFRHRQDALPNSDWTTYGDFTWGVAASGDWTKTSDLSTAPLHDNYSGYVPSGTFYYVSQTHGNGDGFALQSLPATAYPTGTSGVVEVTVDLSNDSEDRAISFDLRVDAYPDDRVYFYTVPEFGSPTLQLTRGQGLWRTYSYTLTAGQEYTLKWVYMRGASGNATDPVSIGSAWIDNVSGINGPPLNGIFGFLRGTLPSDSGTIHGYLNTNISEAIHGYVSGAPLTSEIHGYLSSAVSPDVTSSVYGWLKGNGSWINGYVLASSGEDITTYPTGAIHGYVKVLDSGALSSIHGYVDGRNDQVINGYLIGGSDVAETGAIHGYVAGNNANSYIYGLVNGSGENYTTTSIHGYVDSRYGIGDQVIHGYVSVESGGLSSINGYLLGWDGLGPFSHGPQSMIHGYLFGPPSGTSIHGYVRAIMPYSSIYGYLGSEALVASGGGLVGATSTSNVVAGTNFIHGYIKGHDGSQFIHGYVLGPLGGTSSVHGYVLAGVEDNQINGYVVGVELPTSSIHGFTSGVNWEESEIYGWLQGVSGIENSSILGYAVGAEEVSSTINAKLIGTVARDNSQAACLSHNFTLPALPTVTGIPTVFMNTGV